jgi:hypothetical protein
MAHGPYLMNMEMEFEDMSQGTQNNRDGTVQIPFLKIKVWIRTSEIDLIFINSRCFLDGKFCHGDWFEPNQVNGGYMVRLMSENDMIGSWWQVNASDFDTSTYSTYSRDIGYHGVESRIRIGAAQNCARNADLFFDAGALSAGAIAGIVIGCVFGK